MRGLVEGLIDGKKPVCIVDPKGDWWGIKLAKDGKSHGYPVVIFGGEHADIPIDEHSGASVAELFATGNRPCLIDLGGWMVGQRTRFWIDFASTLFRHTKGSRWLAVDEIHNFAPKGKIFDVDAGKALHWTNRLASEGLGKGLQMIFASQRPQKVHNDTLTSAETLIAMRVLHPSDRGAVSEWIKGCGDSEGSEVLNSLAQMERGEGWVWSPEIHFGPRRVKFPMFKTYDSFRPQTVEDAKKITGWAEVDLEEIRARFASTIARAKADDPKELRRQIAALTAELKTANTFQSTSRPPEPPQIVEVSCFTDDDRRALRETCKILETVLEHGQKLTERIQNAIMKESANPGWKPAARKAFTTAAPPQPRRETRTDRSVTPTLPIGEAKILTAVAQYPEGATRQQLTILTGYKRSSRDAYLARLFAKEFVEYRGDGVMATESGIGALGSAFEPLPTGQELIDHWLRKLPLGEGAVFKILVEKSGKPIHREDISDKTGYQRSSRDAYLARLSARQLVTNHGGGMVAAAPFLFQ